MKHILPILTAVLALSATTASAAYYYDCYYDRTDPDYNPVTQTKEIGGLSESGWSPKYNIDTVSYKDFMILRTSQQGSGLTGSDFYRIQITGKKVDLYLTDLVDNSGSDTNKSNTITKNAVAEYGYRYVNANGSTGDLVPIKLPDNPEVIDSGDVTYFDDNGDPDTRTLTRYKYYLGTFDNGAVIELYMKDNSGVEAYSYSNINNPDPEKASAQGGYADGYKIIGSPNDNLLTDYYNLPDDNTALKAMPLANLDLTLNGSANRVYFGIYGKAVGSPLPSGLPIALVAGLFGLGFWYIRRRKATVA